MSNFNTEKFAATARANTDVMLTVANTLLAASERLAAHNLNAARDLIADVAATTTAVYGVKDVNSLFTAQSSFAKPALEKVVAYNRGLYAIASEAQGALTRVLEAQVAAINTGVLNSIEEAVKHAPAGSEVAVSAVKQAISAANAAYDNVSKATKQAVELAETNVAAATAATLKTVNIETAKSKKAA